MSEKICKDNIQDMGMYDLALNQFFIKDNEVWHRNYDGETECRELIKRIAKMLGLELPECKDNYEFDEMMMELGWYGINDPEGVLSMIYSSMWGMATIREHLKRYEEKEQQEKFMESQLNQIIEAAETLIKKYDTNPSFYIKIGRQNGRSLLSAQRKELVKYGKIEGIKEILSMIRDIQKAEVNNE